MFRLNQNKQTNRNSLIGSIFWYFFRKFWVFPVFVGFFGLFRNSLFWLFCFYTKIESFYVSIEPKQTEDQPEQFEREHIWVFFRKFRVVSVYFKTVFLFWLFRFRFKTNRNKPKYFVSGFTKQTETQPKQILLRFETKFLFVCFEDTLGRAMKKSWNIFRKR